MPRVSVEDAITALLHLADPDIVNAYPNAGGGITVLLSREMEFPRKLYLGYKLKFALAAGVEK